MEGIESKMIGGKGVNPFNLRSQEYLSVLKDILCDAPNNAQIWGSLGFAQFEFDQSEDNALRLMNRGIAIRPHDEMSYAMKGLLLYEMGLKKKDIKGGYFGLAKKEYRKAIALGPQDPISLSQIGILEEGSEINGKYNKRVNAVLDLSS